MDAVQLQWEQYEWWRFEQQFLSISCVRIVLVCLLCVIGYCESMSGRLDMSRGWNTAGLLFRFLHMRNRHHAYLWRTLRTSRLLGYVLHLSGICFICIICFCFICC